MATDFQYKIKAIDAKPHPMTGNKQYEYLLMIDYADGGTAMERSGLFSSKQAATDAINTMIAKHKSSVEGRPVTIKTNYGTETQEVKANQSYALEKEKEALEESLRDLTEDPSNPGYTVSGKQLVDQDTYNFAGTSRKQYAVSDLDKLEATKNRYSEINSVLRSQAPNASVTNRTRQRLEQEGLTVGATQTGSTGATQTGSTGAPTPGPGETIGDTGVLETTVTTPGVTSGGTSTTYTPPVGTAVDPTTGVSTVPTQTGGLSALPPSVTYATRPAGTPGYVQESLLAPSTSGQGPSTYDQWMQQTQQQQAPQTQQGGYIVTMPDGTEQTIAYGQPIPVGAVIKQYVTGAAQGGMMRNGYAEGGSVDAAILKIAEMNGFQGTTPEQAKVFMNSSEGLRSKARAIGAMMNKGGLAMAQGGAVPKEAVIAGQPHRLAYVNPQEEVMMKAAGGAGVPSYGGIPAYFSIGPATAAGIGATVTDPATGIVYTSDGSTWTTSQGVNVGSGLSADAVDPKSTGIGTTEATTVAGTSLEDFGRMQQGLISGTMSPIQSAVSQITPQAEDFVSLDAGQTAPVAPFAEAATVGTVSQAGLPTEFDASTYTAGTSFGDVSGVTSGMQPITGTVSDQAQVTAAQQETSAVSDLKAQQGTAIIMDNPVQREIQDGELVSGAANAQKAAEFAEQIEAATAEPSAKATVQGQLEGLMAQFEGGNTPAWAAGSMRAAMATLSARGLGASSLAGQAVIQAAMEAALPIAQMDAQTQAQFEAQNLSNRQQRAMLAAQQRATFIGQEFDQAFQARVQRSARIGDIANMNFTAEQNIALENSRAANTINLQNLSNAQAMVMAEAAALANLDMANLNNRQQAAVQNAQNFLQMDLTNLGFEQQTAMFKAQQNIQALFTDQAAENAAAQFNATSENQTNQFFANLSSQVSQFNASQQNAMDQFNVNSVNALREFNSNLQQQRDMFNAQNGLVVAQANAQWRQNIATLNTAAQNEANMDFAKTINALTATNLDQIWQRERDIMSFAFTAQQSALDRSLNLLLGDKKIAEVEKQLSAQQDAASTELAFRFLFGSDPAIFGGIFNNKKD